MDPSTLVPKPDQIPAPWWVFELLGGVTLALHLLVMNIVVGSSLIAIYRRFANKPAHPRQVLPGTTPTLLAIGINLGVAPLLFVQVNYGHLLYSSSILMASFWLGVIPMLIIAYYGAYAARDAKSDKLRMVSAIISLLLFLWIAFVFTNNMSLMVRPDRWTAWLDNRDGTILNLGDASLYPRYLHFIVASVAIGGLFDAVLSWWKNPARNVGRLERRNPDDDKSFRDETVRGLRIFAIATIVEAVVGIWYLLSLPRPVILAFMGHNPTATAVLIAGMATATVSIVSAWRNRPWTTVSLAILTVILMVATRAFARSAQISGIFDPATDLVLHNEPSPLLAFLGVFVAGMAVVAWMVSKATSSGEVNR